MKFALTLALVYLIAISLATWLASNPLVFISGIALFPTFMQSIPFGLAVQEDDSPDDPEQPMGFLAAVE
jgi:hypothetical protein